MSQKQSRWAEFKDFTVKGNVVDLAVAVVIATFFGAVVKDVVNLILSIFAIPGKSFRPFAGLQFTIGHGVFQYGLVLQDIITFLIVAAVVFFLVVHPLRVVLDRRRAGEDPDSEDRACPECLSSDIPKAATRCRYCTAQIEPLAESSLP
jgi:large conductance mechanosensitive channel